MHLTDVPAELLLSVTEHVVYSIGIRRSTRLRLVCRAFDRHVLEAIFALPTFEGSDVKVDTDNTDLSWDSRMSKPMVAQLIRLRLKGKSQTRPLVREITHTLEFAKTTLNLTEPSEYERALVSLVANNLPLYRVIESLSERKDVPDASFSCLENALCASLFLDRSHDVHTLLEAGAKSHRRTRTCGDALIIAACHTSLETFTSLLRHAIETGNRISRSLVKSRCVLALEQAGACGRSDIFRHELLTATKPLSAEKLVLFEDAMTSAALHSHSDVVRSILSLNSCSPFYHMSNIVDLCSDAFPKTHLIDVLRLAASNNDLNLVKILFRETNLLSRASSLNLPIEDASRCGHFDMLDLLIAHHTDANLTSYSGAVFWLARNAHYVPLSSLMQTAGRAGLTLLEDASCGASVHGVTGLLCVLDMFVSYIAPKYLDDSRSRKLNETIHGIRQDQGKDHSDSAIVLAHIRRDIASTIPPHARIINASQGYADDPGIIALADAVGSEKSCEIFDLSTVQRLAHDASIPPAGAKAPWWPTWKRGFAAAIEHTRPAILQYWCDILGEHIWQYHDNFPHESPNESTAIFQVLLDYAWSADKLLRQARPSSDKSRSNHIGLELIRWLLAKGANTNPNSEEERYSNLFDGANACHRAPLPKAMDQAPLSVVKFMLRHGAHLRDGRILLHAIDRDALDKLAMIDSLLILGDCINTRFVSRRGSKRKSISALERAVYSDDVEVVRLLLDRGADCLSLNEKGRTVLDTAREDADQVEIIKMLEEHLQVEKVPALERDVKPEGSVAGRKRLYVIREGKVADENGSVVGVIVKGDPVRLRALPVDKNGDIVDKRGRIINHAQLVPE